MSQAASRPITALIVLALCSALSGLPPPAKAQASAAPLRLFVVHLTTGPGWQKDVAVGSQSGFKEHSANLQRMRAEGKLVVGARYQDSQADKGMLVLRLPDRAAVEREFSADPMVGSQHFQLDIAEFNPFYGGVIERPATRPASESPTPLAPLAWLAGCWEGRYSAGGKAVQTSEYWMPEAGGVMLGIGRTLRDGKLSNHESPRIALDADGQTPVYYASPSGLPEVRFPLKSGEGGRFVFENLALDFPQRVTYQREPDGSLLARMEGDREGKRAPIDYRLRRVHCG